MLSGNLELFALDDVLRFVARSGATGAVNIYRSEAGGRILLVDGEVVGAVVDDHSASDPDGVVDAGLRLLDGGAGDFALEIETVSGPTRQPVEEFLKAAGRRRAEWRKIISAVGSLDDPFELSGLVPSGTSEINLTPLEWLIAVHADGRKTLRDIAHESGASDFSVATAVLAMANAGLVELAGVVHADDSVEDEEPEASGAAASEEDLDPAELLRELGEQRPGGARGRRLPATRTEQRLRLRSR